MARNRILLVLLALLVMLAAAPVAHAQSTADINFSDIIDALGPRSGDALLWDVFLYAIFFIGLLNIFLIPDKQLFPAMLNLLVMGLAVVSKLLVGYPPHDPVLSPVDFPVLVFNAGMFVLPLIIAGMQRSVKGKPSKATIPAILMGLLGGGYFFLFWAMEQRGVPL
jgi:hypothetical protein